MSTYKPRSAVIIAELLGAEGFSDHTAAQVKRYWKLRVMNPERAERVASIERAFKKWVEKLDDTDKLILGKFIGIRTKMGFDTGLRCGLATRIHFDGSFETWIDEEAARTRDQIIVGRAARAKRSGT